MARIISVLLFAAFACFGQRQAKPEPTYRNVAYGTHERNVLDFWKAASGSPTPLVVYIHGGGFRGGRKESIDAGTLQELLGAGISVAAIHYRFVQQKRLPASHDDSRRAIQFLRAKSKEWNIDKTRVGAFGGSAGAQICMWLAFHDEMARPDSADPIERESTRLTAVATNGGQTTMDFDWWKKWIPEYTVLHRKPDEIFDAGSEAEIRQIVQDISALSIISVDDPPIHMNYRMAPKDPVPADPTQAQGWKVHHVIFGVKLKERMDSLGIEADLGYPGTTPKYSSIAQFFKAKFGGVAP